MKKIKKLNQIIMDEVMSESVSYRWENEKYLLEVFMNQLGISKDDLENDPSWIKAKVREANIDKVLDK